MVMCYDVQENALNILSIAPQIPSLVKLTLDPIVFPSKLRAERTQTPRKPLLSLHHTTPFIIMSAISRPIIVDL